MNATPEGAKPVSPVRIRVVRDGVSTNIEADEIWVTLPNGIEFVLEHRRPDGYLTALAPFSPDDPESVCFVVRPGAMNVVSLGAERHAQRRDIQEP